MLAGHVPQSLTQYTKYDNSFHRTDIVKMIEEHTFEEVEMINKFVEGMYSKANVFAPLTSNEYKTFVKEKLKEEEDELRKVKTKLKATYGTLAKAYSMWTEEEFIIYSNVYKLYKNKQYVLRRAAMKVLSAKRKDEALAEMKVDDSEEEEEQKEEEEEEEDDDEEEEEEDVEEEEEEDVEEEKQEGLS